MTAYKDSDSLWLVFLDLTGSWNKKTLVGIELGTKSSSTKITKSQKNEAKGPKKLSS